MRILIVTFSMEMLITSSEKSVFISLYCAMYSKNITKKNIKQPAAINTKSMYYRG